ncbi:Ni/Fe-hydrogenase cytochrome b subunit [Geobacter anodireducens]|uniref:Ni/Fe-hydrogenase cytochrome b subunit n=1 Tax=Geobacter anodireducens TaxID=1340425 RepID=A0ABR9NZN0_9BACT|nr:Ni/Fe-hydrogenase cytochrome b subunit [Geobacter anodireducens]MBE2889698.1 Ni/Fe-hydrogenase cytochrome b subunit [Geobacter anodireducens]
MGSHHDEYQVQPGTILTRPFFILLFFVLVGLALIAYRFFAGVGAVTGLSDGYPWGIWIAYDVATGTAFACGGYALALLIYIMNRWKYHPLIRSAILTSVFGYCLAGFSVMVDLGRYWNAYGFFMPSRWQGNSVMFEVALCVMSYSTVLIIEFLPAVLYTLEHSKWKWVRESSHWLYARLIPDTEGFRNGLANVSKAAGHLQVRLDKVLIFFIVLGITLPSMHQSSLGSMMIIAGEKLSPLWQTGFLPLLFLINCIFIGYSTVMFESILSSFGFKRAYEVHELSGIARIVPWVAGLWMAIRFGDLIWRNQIPTILTFDKNALFFLLEVLLIGGGAFMMLSRRNRLSPRLLFLSGAILMLGGGLYRFNVYLIGFNPGEGWSYFPSVAEFLITVGIIAIEILGYLTLVKIFPVMPNPKKHFAEEGKEVVGETAGRVAPGGVYAGK